MKRKHSEAILATYELKRVIYLDVNIELNGKLPVEIKVSLFKRLGSKDRYRARVARLEHYRIQPSFPQRKGVPAHQASDEEIWVQDPFFQLGEREMRATSVTDAIQQLLSAIKTKID